MRGILKIGACSALVLATTGAVFAQSSIKTFEYDALGRLVEVRTSGGQNANEAREYCYDAAGNRVRVRSSNNGSSINCPTPTPTPPST